MNQEPRHQGEYDSRQTQAARRVLVDLGQVLAAFHDCLVVVGGWVPDLLLPGAEDPHVGASMLTWPWTPTNSATAATPNC
jgi:hypothetical protein